MDEKNADHGGVRPDPLALGMRAAFTMVAAPAGKTFFYRNEHKRVIEAQVLDQGRLREVNGPLIYGVTDQTGVLRYIGKWISPTPLYARWFRHDHVHHQTSSRTQYLRELDSGRSPLTVWSACSAEIRQLMLTGAPANDTSLIEGIEALWINRWKSQLWNKQTPSIPIDFHDGDYWKN